MELLPYREKSRVSNAEDRDSPSRRDHLPTASNCNKKTSSKASTKRFPYFVASVKGKNSYNP